MTVLCPMCNQQVENDKIFLTVGSNNLLECPVCGFIFADRNGIVYKYSNRDYFENSEWKELESFQNKAVYRDYLNMVAKYKKSGSWLDIGFGKGVLLRYALGRGYAVCGVEESLIAVNHIKSECPKGTWMTLEEYVANPPFNHFDIVTILHVLEHIIDFRSAFQMASRCLKRNGLLVIEVPNIHCIQAKVKGSKWRWAIQNHINFFTKKNIVQLVEECGCKVLRIEYKFTQNRGSLATFTYRTKILIKRVLEKIGFGQAIAIYAQKRQM